MSLQIVYQTQRIEQSTSIVDMTQLFRDVHSSSNFISNSRSITAWWDRWQMPFYPNWCIFAAIFTVQSYLYKFHPSPHCIHVIAGTTIFIRGLIRLLREVFNGCGNCKIATLTKEIRNSLIIILRLCVNNEMIMNMRKGKGMITVLTFRTHAK